MRPFIDPRRARRASCKASSGAIQLLVRTASSFVGVQMKVFSTRATSFGFERWRCPAGGFSALKGSALLAYLRRAVRRTRSSSGTHRADDTLGRVGRNDLVRKTEDACSWWAASSRWWSSHLRLLQSGPSAPRGRRKILLCHCVTLCRWPCNHWKVHACFRRVADRGTFVPFQRAPSARRGIANRRTVECCDPMHDARSSASPWRVSGARRPRQRARQLLHRGAAARTNGKPTEGGQGGDQRRRAFRATQGSAESSSRDDKQAERPHPAARRRATLDPRASSPGCQPRRVPLRPRSPRGRGRVRDPRSGQRRAARHNQELRVDRGADGRGLRGLHQSTSAGRVPWNRRIDDVDVLVRQTATVLARDSTQPPTRPTHYGRTRASSSASRSPPAASDALVVRIAS